MSMHVSCLAVGSDAIVKVSSQPIFCFETALKLLFWSDFAYGLRNGMSSLHAKQDQLMAMFGLEVILCNR